MALRLRHWLFGALAGCALVAVAFLPPERWLTRWGFDPTPPAEARRLETLVRRYHDRLHRLELLDSLLPVARSRSDVSTDFAPLSLDPAMPPIVRSRVTELLVEPLEVLRTSGARPFFVASVFDTTPPLANAPWSPVDELVYYLPPATDGETCLVVWALKAPTQWVSGRRESHGPLSLGADTAAYLLGPCGYFAMFGSPGSEIARWLGARSYDVTRFPFWLTGSEPEWQISPDDLRPQWPMFRSSGIHACAAGHEDDCRRSVLGERRARDGAEMPILVARRWYWSSSLGPDTPRFFSDLVQEISVERFAEFWRSELDLESAFETAFGVSLGQWTMEWSRRQLGRVRGGPGVPVGVAAVALLVSALLVAVSAAYVTRRQAR